MWTSSLPQWPVELKSEAVPCRTLWLALLPCILSASASDSPRALQAMTTGALHEEIPAASANARTALDLIPTRKIIPVRLVTTMESE